MCWCRLGAPPDGMLQKLLYATVADDRFNAVDGVHDHTDLVYRIVPTKADIRLFLVINPVELPLCLSFVPVGPSQDSQPNASVERSQTTPLALDTVTQPEH